MDQWPQHPTEPRFSYATPPRDQPHRFMLSNDVDPQECQRRMQDAVEWLLDTFGRDMRRAEWSRHGLLMKITSDNMAFHFRLRFC